MKKRVNKLAILAIFTLIIAVFAAAPVMAKTKYKLIKSCTMESYDYTKKAWIKPYAKVSLKYDKKSHVKAITRKDYEKGKLTDKTVRTFKNKYRKGKITQRTENDTFRHKTVITTFKKEVPVRTYWDDDGYVAIHKYKYKGRYATSDTRTTYGSDTDDKTVSITKYKVKLKKGFPVKITNFEKYFDDESGWATTSTIVKFNKKGKAKGLIKSVVRDYSDSKDTYIFKYKFKKGRVLSVTITNTEIDKTNNSTSKNKSRCKFSYAKKTIKAKRYGSMINGTVAFIPEPDDLSGSILHDFFVTFWF